MVYNTHNCWVFGLRPSSSILENRKHNVSENGCFPHQVRVPQKELTQQSLQPFNFRTEHIQFPKRSVL
jgi:hypothetical protein